MRELASPQSFVIYGRSRPKGSMEHIGRGRMKESVKGSSAWKATVAETIERTIGDVTPVDVPALVWLRVVLDEEVTSLRAGDIDKHARNALDALVQGGLLRDDSLVVGLNVTKERGSPARIEVLVEW